MRKSGIRFIKTMWSRAQSQFQHGNAYFAAYLQSVISGNGWSTLWNSQPWLDGRLQTACRAEHYSGPLSNGGERPSRGGSAHGRPIGTHGGRNPDGSPRFDQALGKGAYLWWYLDALSDDRQHGIVIIAFVGSVFSPYYAKAHQKSGNGDPENHCTLNVAIYSPGKNRWTMTERSARSSHRSANEFVIGPSSLRWDKDCLTIEIRERAVPFGQAVRGTVRIYPEQLFNFSTALDDQGRHRWGPLAPRARVQVELSKPDLHWQGNGYLDSNEGDGPLAPDFHEWDWSRAELSGKRTAVIYDVRQKNGVEKLHALLFHPDGRVEPFVPPPRQTLPKTAWQIQRQMRNADQPSLKLIQTLEDTPFYARSILSSELLGESVISFHETLNVPRFASPIVQWMLAWRMPRIR